MVRKLKRVRVDEGKNQVTVIFDMQFYRPESIRLSVEDFGNCCSARIRSRGDKILVTLSPKRNDIVISTLGYEFYNYVLGRMRSDGSRF